MGVGNHTARSVQVFAGHVPAFLLLRLALLGTPGPFFLFFLYIGEHEDQLVNWEEWSRLLRLEVVTTTYTTCTALGICMLALISGDLHVLRLQVACIKVVTTCSRPAVAAS